MYHFQASTMAREPCMYGYICKYLRQCKYLRSCKYLRHRKYLRLCKYLKHCKYLQVFTTFEVLGQNWEFLAKMWSLAKTVILAKTQISQWKNFCFCESLEKGSKNKTGKKRSGWPLGSGKCENFLTSRHIGGFLAIIDRTKMGQHFHK